MKQAASPMTALRPPETAGGQAGFSLLELLVALAIFTVIGGVAFRLFRQQQSSYSMQEGQVGLNLALRNAVSQMQMDLANAGSGYFQGINIPTWPVGVTIVNNIVGNGNSCYHSAQKAYGPTCFDQINVIAAANPSAFPPVNATDSSGGASPTANCSDTSTGSAYGQPAAGLTLAQTAAKFLKYDQLLFLNSTGQKITSVVLTQNAAVSGSAVLFTFNATNSDGTNSVANDPLAITSCNGAHPCSAGNKLSTQFCGADWILKLAPVTYEICAGPGSPAPCDQTAGSPDIADPKLMRVQNGTASLVMDQVIGFKVGAAIWNSTSSSSSTQYIYDASAYTNQTPNDMAYNYTLVRSVRISLIARTTPSSDPSYKFRNAFDQGSYQVQGIAVVVNPRNLSMND